MRSPCVVAKFPNPTKAARGAAISLKDLVVSTWIKYFVIRREVRRKRMSVPIAFPLYNMRSNYSDPEKTNIIFPQYEWDLELPQKEISDEDRDHLVFHGSDPETGDQILVSFDRTSSGLCNCWVVLRINGAEYDYSSELEFDQSRGLYFSGGGLRLECDAPMRRWRIAFNGVMNPFGTEEEVHVRFGVRFSAGSHPFEYPRNIPTSELAPLFDQQPPEQMTQSLDRFCDGLIGYAQSGSMYCDIKVDDDEKTCCLFGGRVRNLRSPLHDTCSHFYGYATNGAVFHLIQTAEYSYGCCFSPVHQMEPAKKVRISQDTTLVSFKSSHVEYKIQWTPRRQNELKFVTSNINDNVSFYEGTLTIRNDVFKVEAFKVVSAKQTEEISIPEGILQHRLSGKGDSDKLVVSVSDNECRIPELTGGKGCCLSVLTSTAAQFKTFVVPKAVVVTVKAFEAFHEQPKVQKAIDDFFKIVGTTRHLKEACENCVKVLERAQAPQPVKIELSSLMAEIFGKNWGDMKFAVRSSIVEDFEDMSGATQTPNFLGVAGKQDLYIAIVKCWASQFTFSVLNYKRQYGQSLKSRMAVVVQEMVDAESAGVMYTCDPVTGNPQISALTANYGLAEALGSSSPDPDIFRIIKEEGRFSVTDVMVGKKSRKVDGSDPAGPSLLKLGDDNKRTCITKELALRLATIGSEVDSCFGAGRDIEWAVLNGEVYLFQCRPVASFFQESDFEIAHDLSVALRTSRELLSRANYDEILPGAVTPLSLSYLDFLFDTFGKVEYTKLAPGLKNDESPYCYLTNHCIGKRLYINLSEGAFKGDRGRVKAMVLSMLGRNVSDEDAFSRSIGHKTMKKNRWFLDFMKTIQVVVNIVTDKQLAENAERMAESYKIEIHASMTAKQIFRSIVKGMHKSKNAAAFFAASSVRLMALNMTILSLLCDLTEDHEPSPSAMTLFTRLLKSNSTDESEIPSSLEKVAEAIRGSSCAAFTAMDDKAAFQWLDTSNEKAAKKFREFLTNHGHRGYRELDLHSNPWEMDPLKVVRPLKAAVEVIGTKLDPGLPASLKDLTAEFPAIKRQLLMALVPRAKSSADAGETTKSCLVKVVHTMRKAVRILGGKMVEEGRLPDADLVHFLTFDELSRLLLTRNASLVIRSIRRSRLHSKLDSEKFEGLQCGMPLPIAEEHLVFDRNATKWMGTPVSEGEVQGPARVVKDFEKEAHLIKKGEILITNALNISYTPYFPLLAGVVSEIGGLLSHGAVIARKYGLPAIVGVTGATHIFNNGDMVHIKTKKGFIAKLDAPEICASPD